MTKVLEKWELHLLVKNLFQKSFYGAEKLCASHGMHLAHLENKQQTDAISENFKSIGFDAIIITSA